MKVLLIEDDAMHSNYMMGMVHAALPEVDEVLVARNGKDGERLARDQDVSRVIMDLRMKERNGIEAARTIWAERPNTRILFWSNYSDEAYLHGITRIVPNGAAYGYLLKTTNETKLQLALRSVLGEGQVVVDREVNHFQTGQKQTSNMLNDVELTILMDVALGLPDKSIAERRGQSLRTIQNRLLSIYDKLEVELGGSKDVGVNKRVRAVAQGVKRQIINSESIESAEKELTIWLSAL
ncbi:response regulator [Falsihalocynthiibacter sp. S25ZX9]|uniref:response regulator n=1 Tax=unclassified Falsihalocynthiibacter TaxID=2854191 RepID=UPI00350F45A4